MGTTHTSTTPKAYPKSMDAQFNAWVIRFWDHIFLSQRGSAPSPLEREAVARLSDRAALLLYRDHQAGKCLAPIMDTWIHAIERASLELIAGSDPEVTA